LVPSATTWHGKPDVYHAFNACVLPPSVDGRFEITTDGRTTA
jgi:hypothetical protein